MEQTEKRKAYLKKYQREYHQKPHMVKYMKEYHADAARKEKVKEKRNTPEGKIKKAIAAKKWRNSPQGKAYFKKYADEHREELRANNRRAYYKRMGYNNE